MSVTCKRIKALPVVQPPDQFEIIIDMETAKTLFDVLQNVGGADGAVPGHWSRRAHMAKLHAQLYELLPEYRDRVVPTDVDPGMRGVIFFKDVPRPVSE